MKRLRSLIAVLGLLALPQVAMAQVGPITNPISSDLNGLTVTGGFTYTADATPASVSTSPGTAAQTAMTTTGGVGGATTSTAATTVGGQGGGNSFTMGAGGTASGVSGTSNTGGAGGDWTITGATGGVASNSSGTNIGGRGSNITLTAGNGGSTNGAGGIVQLAGGTANGTGAVGGVRLAIPIVIGAAGTGTPSSNSGLFLSNNVTIPSSSGVTQGITVSLAVDSSATGQQSGISSRIFTANASYTVGSAYNYAGQTPFIQGSSVITTSATYESDSQNKASTNNYAALLNQPALANGIGSTTDSIAIKVPTATNAMADQTATTTNAMSALLGTQTYTSTTNTRTITNAYTLDIAGQPVCSTNVTCTNAPGSLRVEGGDSIFGSAALATNATTGFVYLPTSAGLPSGTAATHTGTAAHEFDTTNNLLWSYNSGWKAPGQQMTVGDTGLLTLAQATTYFCGISGCSTTQGNAWFPSAVATTASSMYVTLSGNVGGSAQTVTVTMMGGAAGTTAEAVTCTINTGASTCSDLTHQFAVAAGDLLSVRVVTSATTGSFAQVSISFAR